MFIIHPFIKQNAVESREYQENLASVALTGNTLVVMPTALGKTIVATLVIAEVLKSRGKILLLAPTKPLVLQHDKSLKNFLTLNEDEFTVLTGEVKQSEREEQFEKSRIITATPQTVRNEIIKGRLKLRDIGLLIVDECHRSVSRYSYVDVALIYRDQNPSGLILGLTASPSSEKIKEIVQNLSVKNIEVRKETDDDVKKYIPDKETQAIMIDLPKEFCAVKENLKAYYDQCENKLIEMKFLHRKNVTKREVLELQNYLISRKIFAGIPYTSAMMKISHAVALIETQGAFALKKYFEKLEKETTRTSKMILKNENILLAKRLNERILENGKEHPKMAKLCEIVQNELAEKPGTKLIVFANYRDSAQTIVNELNKISDARVIRFVGQATKGKDIGLKQGEQEKILNEFRKDAYNVLVCTSVGEEGLDIPSVDTVVFYETVPSAIRTIQRSGRTGRKHAGKIIFLITKKTRDETYYWMSIRKKKKMHDTLDKVRKKTQSAHKRGQTTMNDYE